MEDGLPCIFKRALSDQSLVSTPTLSREPRREEIGTSGCDMSGVRMALDKFGGSDVEDDPWSHTARTPKDLVKEAAKQYSPKYESHDSVAAFAIVSHSVTPQKRAHVSTPCETRETPSGGLSMFDGMADDKVMPVKQCKAEPKCKIEAAVCAAASRVQPINPGWGGQGKMLKGKAGIEKIVLRKAPVKPSTALKRFKATETASAVKLISAGRKLRLSMKAMVKSSERLKKFVKSEAIHMSMWLSVRRCTLAAQNAGAVASAAYDAGKKRRCMFATGEKSS